jgi:ABC-type ATPase with predicted acetyltransferase domain
MFRFVIRFVDRSSGAVVQPRRQATTSAILRHRLESARAQHRFIVFVLNRKYAVVVVVVVVVVCRRCGKSPRANTSPVTCCTLPA